MTVTVMAIMPWDYNLARAGTGPKAPKVGFKVRMLATARGELFAVGDYLSLDGPQSFALRSRGYRVRLVRRVYVVMLGKPYIQYIHTNTYIQT